MAARPAPPRRPGAQQVPPRPARSRRSAGRRRAAARAAGAGPPVLTAARRSAPRPAAPIRPGPPSARARLPGGHGAARHALRPLAPWQGARHPPAAAAPRAACPLFWSRCPAAPPLTASERGAGQSARRVSCAPPSGPAPPRAPPPRAPPPGKLGWLAPRGAERAHVPRGAPRSHWSARERGLGASL